MLNRIVRPFVEQVPLGIICLETSNNIHVNMAQCPRNELVEHERGMGETKRNWKWHPVDDEPTYYPVRWIGEIAMRRDHLVIMIRDLDAPGKIGVVDNLSDVR